MKKLIITFGISGILLTGCVDLLQEPLSFPTPENIEYTEENVTSLANGLYTSLWGGNYAYNCRTILMGLGADDVSCGSYTKRGVHWDQLHVDMASMENDFMTMWDNMYKLIQGSNQLIEGLTATSSMTEEEKKDEQEVKQEEKKEETSKSNTSESKKDNTASTSSSSNKNNSSSSKPSNSGSNNSGSSKPSNNSGSKPAEHTHNWVAQYKTVNVPEKGHNEQVLVQAAYDEQVPITEMKAYSICNDCGADITGNTYEHVKDHMINDTGNGGYHTEWRETVVGYNTVHHDAVYETRYVVDSPATTKQELTGYKCSGCGKTKAN